MTVLNPHATAMFPTMGWLLITGVSLGKAAMMPRIFCDKARQHLNALASPCDDLTQRLGGASQQEKDGKGRNLLGSEGKQGGTQTRRNEMKTLRNDSKRLSNRLSSNLQSKLFGQVPGVSKYKQLRFRQGVACNIILPHMASITPPRFEAMRDIREYCLRSSEGAQRQR